MHDDDPLKDEPKAKADDNSGVSRRDFLKISTISAAAVPIPGNQDRLHGGHSASPSRSYGPGKATFEITINGQKHALQLEPRVTLLDALRDQLEITGAKRVCDRAECGACTVLIDKKVVYACSILAIEGSGGNPSPRSKPRCRARLSILSNRHSSTTMRRNAASARPALSWPSRQSSIRTPMRLLKRSATASAETSADAALITEFISRSRRWRRKERRPCLTTTGLMQNIAP